jgi:hypothetical protein
MKNQENTKQEEKEKFDINIFIAKQEDTCSKKLQEVLEEYNCMLIPEVLISSEGIKPNLKVKYIK